MSRNGQASTARELTPRNRSGMDRSPPSTVRSVNSHRSTSRISNNSVNLISTLHFQIHQHEFCLFPCSNISKWSFAFLLRHYQACLHPATVVLPLRVPLRMSCSWMEYHHRIIHTYTHTLYIYISTGPNQPVNTSSQRVSINALFFFFPSLTEVIDQHAVKSIKIFYACGRFL